MKKIVVGILTAAVVASSAVTGMAGHVQSKAATQESNYVDFDGNGICDNYTGESCKGICTGVGTGNSHHRYSGSGNCFRGGRNR